MENHAKELSAAPVAPPQAEELLKKLQELEIGHAQLKQEMSKLMNSPHSTIHHNYNQRPHSISPQRVPWRRAGGGDGGLVAAWRRTSASFQHSSLQRESSSKDVHSGGAGGRPAAMNLTDKQYLNILQSMGQSVHILDFNGRIVYWNRSAENLYGYSAAEALGQDIFELITDGRDIAVGRNIIRRVMMGENWTGNFPVKHKRGNTFLVIATNTSFYDDNGSLAGMICVSSDSRPFLEAKAVISAPKPVETNSRLASAKLGLDSHQPLQAAISSKITNFASKVSDKFKSKKRSGENRLDRDIGSGNSLQSDHGFSDAAVSDHREDAASSGSSTPRGDGGNTSITDVNKITMESDCLDYEILWEDLTIGEKIGQGSCGTVYHALWYGSDVAVKVFSWQEYSDDVIFSFKQEVSLMKSLRHPNILLFMGAVTTPQRLCIVTEFLPQGSLFQLLKRNTSKLDWKRRIHVALDIARGMNYLHRCNPPIVHRDLKSSNILVGKNWTVKVGDFGLSRLKHETFLTTKTGRGTPQWMAPEVIRSEPSGEKADVYSFGVILWELVTQKIPWDNLNSMQVIGAVGFVNQRLEIPKDVDPQWASIIENCWQSEPQFRPSFQELVGKLKDLQRQFVIQFQARRNVAGDCGQKES